MMRDGTGGSPGATRAAAPWDGSGIKVPIACLPDADVPGCDPRILLMAFSTRLMIRPCCVASGVNQLHQPPLRDQQYCGCEEQHRCRRSKRKAVATQVRLVILDPGHAHPANDRTAGRGLQL